MEKKQAIHSAALVVRNNKIVFRHQKDKDAFKAFEASLGEGVSVEIHYAAAVEEGTLKKLSQIHAAIRVLANETGTSEDEMKKQIKRKGGYMNGQEYKSFGDMSLAQLDAVFKTVCEVGDFIGCSVR